MAVAMSIDDNVADGNPACVQGVLIICRNCSTDKPYAQQINHIHYTVTHIKYILLYKDFLDEKLNLNISN